MSRCQDSEAEAQFTDGDSDAEPEKDFYGSSDDSDAEMTVNNQSGVPLTDADYAEEDDDQFEYPVGNLHSIKMKLYDENGEISDDWRLKGEPYDDDEVEEGQRHNINWEKVHSSGLFDIAEPPPCAPDNFINVGHQRIPRTLFDNLFKGSFEKASDWCLTHTLCWPIEQKRTSTDDILAKMLEKKAAHLEYLRGDFMTKFMQNLKNIEPENLPSPENLDISETQGEEALAAVDPPAANRRQPKNKKVEKLVKPNAFFKQYILGQTGKPLSELLVDKLFRDFNTEDSESPTPAKCPSKRLIPRQPPIALNDEESEYEHPKTRGSSRRVLARGKGGQQDDVQDSRKRRRKEHEEDESSAAGSPFIRTRAKRQKLDDTTPVQSSSPVGGREQKIRAPRAPKGGDASNYERMTVKQIDGLLRQRGMKPYFKERTKLAYIAILLEDDAKKAAEKAQAARAKEVADNAKKAEAARAEELAGYGTFTLVDRSKTESKEPGPASKSPKLTPEAVRQMPLPISPEDDPQTPSSITPEAQDTEYTPTNSNDMSPTPQPSLKRQRDPSLEPSNKRTKRIYIRIPVKPQNRVKNHRNQEGELMGNRSDVMGQNNSIQPTSRKLFMRKPARSKDQNHMAEGRDRVPKVNQVREPAHDKVQNHMVEGHNGFSLSGRLSASEFPGIANYDVFQRRNSNSPITGPGSNFMYRQPDMDFDYSPKSPTSFWQAIPPSNPARNSSLLRSENQCPEMGNHSTHQNLSIQSTPLAAQGQRSRMASSSSHQAQSSQPSPLGYEGQVPTMADGVSDRGDLAQQQYLRFEAANRIPRNYSAGLMQRNPLLPPTTKVENQQPPMDIGNYQAIHNYQPNNFDSEIYTAAATSFPHNMSSPATPDRFRGNHQAMGTPSTSFSPDQPSPSTNLTSSPHFAAPQNDGSNFAARTQGGYGNGNDLSNDGSTSTMPRRYQSRRRQ